MMTPGMVSRAALLSGFLAMAQGPALAGELTLDGELKQAGELTLDGELKQGGIILGTAAPGSKITMDGVEVRVSPQGRFVFGFGRDYAAQAKLTVTYPDGSSEERPLTVARRPYEVQRIDGLPREMVTPPREVLDRIGREAAQVVKARATESGERFFTEDFIWPVVGPISGVYGSQRVLNGKPRRPHFGIDVAMPTGTPVKAPAGGIVTLSETDLYFSGGTVILDHGHGLSSTLMHLDEVSVKTGDRIAQGQVIGTVGATGRATGPHLDWRMNWFRERVDPSVLVPPMPAGR